MMMRKRKWCERFLSNLWIFRQEELPNLSFCFLCECICKVLAYYANSSPTHHPFAYNEAVDTRALIDSGASISCINWGFVRKHKLPTQHLKTPMQARNMDNSINSKGVVQFSTPCSLTLEEYPNESPSTSSA